ncbi:MAG: NifU family protein, partial [Victivallales bacterium]|nr:NifU family protein [Victivallales bacterium]
RVSAVLEEKILPALQKDGGGIELEDIDGGVVKVRLTGHCSACARSSLTIGSFVEAQLRKDLSPRIKVEQVR